jgi:hypothetical protein
MVARFIQLVRLLIVLVRGHRGLVTENPALRHQLAVYRRTRPRSAIRWSHRLFSMGLRSAWPSALGIVRPATRVGAAAGRRSAPTFDASSRKWPSRTRSGAAPGYTWPSHGDAVRAPVPRAPVGGGQPVGRAGDPSPARKGNERGNVPRRKCGGHRGWWSFRERSRHTGRFPQLVDVCGVRSASAANRPSPHRAGCSRGGTRRHNAQVGYCRILRMMVRDAP